MALNEGCNIGQGEILECLKKNKKPMSGKQIANELGIYDKTAYALLNKLMKWDEIYAKEITSEEAIKLFGSKRRMYIYSYKREWLDKF